MEISEKVIDELVQDILEENRGKESEFFYLIPNFYIGAFERISRSGKASSDVIIKRTPTWIRATNGFVLGLNQLLPNFIPLKNLNSLNTDNVKEILHEVAFQASIKKLTLLGHWIYAMYNRYIDNIQVKDGIPVLIISNISEGYKSYVDAVSSSDEGARILGALQRRLISDEKIAPLLLKRFKELYGFQLENLLRASDFIRKEIDNIPIPVYPANKIRQVFQKNIGNFEADKMLKSLTYGKNKSVRTSPMVPVEGGQLLICPWIFDLGTVVDNHVKKIMAEEPLKGVIGNFMGIEFERYVKEKLTELGLNPVNVKASSSEFPSIKPILTGIGKKESFELDILVPADNMAYLISCKGGKKEIPTGTITQMWAEYPEAEIKERISENKTFMREIEGVAQCFEKEPELAKKYGVSGMEFQPILMYSTIQPLSIEELRNEENVNFKTIIMTPDEFIKSLSN